MGWVTSKIVSFHTEWHNSNPTLSSEHEEWTQRKTKAHLWKSNKEYVQQQSENKKKYFINCQSVNVYQQLEP